MQRAIDRHTEHADEAAEGRKKSQPQPAAGSCERTPQLTSHCCMTRSTSCAREAESGGHTQRLGCTCDSMRPKSSCRGQWTIPPATGEAGPPSWRARSLFRGSTWWKVYLRCRRFGRTDTFTATPTYPGWIVMQDVPLYCDGATHSEASQQWDALRRAQSELEPSLINLAIFALCLRSHLSRLCGRRAPACPRADSCRFGCSPLFSVFQGRLHRPYGTSTVTYRTGRCGARSETDGAYVGYL
jgi:hypothetical protein